MNEKGAPSPVAWTRVRAPQGSMDPTPADVFKATVDASPLLAKYGTPVDSESATEMIDAKESAAAASEKAHEEAERTAEEADRIAKQQGRSRRTTRRSTRQSPMERAAG